MYVSEVKFILSLALVKHKYASHRLNVFSVKDVETLCLSNWNGVTVAHFMTGLSGKIVSARKIESLLVRVLI